ncbi:MAG: tRNA preQ1(34) S-adenosylmethionine ribosyltransferase-isomerase QueA [Leptospirillum sp.]|jgi:S-adenosylmethionine:tRNA ribosyltransferase-isomerase
MTAPSSPSGGSAEEKEDIASSSYDYELPQSAIRLSPPENRDGSRMMVVPRRLNSRQELVLDHVSSLPDYLLPGDLIVLNDTRVIPARVYGQTSSGRAIEVLFLSFGSASDSKVLFLARNPGKTSTEIEFPGGMTLSGIRRLDGKDCYEGLLPQGLDIIAWLERSGEMPLPPYIQKYRKADKADRERYQTVFSRTPGSVAAPTAGLHLSGEILERLDRKGVEKAFVTLHVGMGTFRPLSANFLGEHQMHEEWFSVPETTVDLMEKTKKRGGRIIAVGTTVVRTLESMARSGKTSGDTDLFIRPGHFFVHVDGLLTNFHQPRSTLLVLLDAFLGGEDRWRVLYREALSRGLSFLSYGDACLILPSEEGRSAG